MALDNKQALDLAGAGRWDDAHEMVQAHSDKLACLIHAYLHRVEGDLGNARYWYNRAREAMPANTEEQELERLYRLISDQRK
ncbi:hypothetical protein [Methylomarinum vadi]|uniref:hypothetical protein n=1 Tax=Methylomarinum vadi TaxID=438855 RepID=UPI0004DFC2BF|nr:hypothetical protein [Methylomarinum vadi]